MMVNLKFPIKDANGGHLVDPTMTLGAAPAFLANVKRFLVSPRMRQNLFPDGTILGVFNHMTRVE